MWGTTKKNDLWVKVLRAKYKCSSDLIPSIKSYKNSSQLWAWILEIVSLYIEEDNISSSAFRNGSG